MKKILVILFLLFLSCKEHKQSSDNSILKAVPTEETTNPSSDNTISKKIDRKEITNPSSDNIQKDSILIVQNDFEINELLNYRLIGMELNEDDKENDPYKKYSVDFTGACYSSDLCVFEITKKEITIQNYYDSNVTFNFKIKSYKVEENQLILTIEEDDFQEIIITKVVDDISVYKLIVKGETLKDIRMSQFLAKESIISKFGGIDCGDFDG